MCIHAFDSCFHLKNGPVGVYTSIMDMLTDRVLKTCEAIYQQLGPAHNECVYQKALILELYNMGATSVEFEKHVPVFFKDSNDTIHTIGDERVDVLATFNKPTNYDHETPRCLLLELKAVSRNKLNTYVEQLKKYKKALGMLGVEPDTFMLVNFPQGSGNHDGIEWSVYHEMDAM